MQDREVCLGHTLLLLELVLIAITLALDLSGSGPLVLCLSTLAVMRAKLCVDCWQAIRRGVSSKGIVRMCNFCISSIMPMVKLESSARARLQAKTFHYYQYAQTQTAGQQSSYVLTTEPGLPVWVGICVQRTHERDLLEINIREDKFMIA